MIACFQLVDVVRHLAVVAVAVVAVAAAAAAAAAAIQ